MADLLSSASLLLTIIGIFYGLWYPEIRKSIEEKIPQHKEDFKAPRNRVALTLTTRAIPLLGIAMIVALVFLPDAVKIFINSILTYQKLGLINYFSKYDSVSTAFFVVDLIAISISVHLGRMTISLLKLSKKLTT